PVSDEVMAALTSTVTPQGVVAVAAFLDRSLEDAIAPGARCVPVLIHVRDPGNAGTILRSADAAGADAVVFARASVDVYNPKVVRASAGSLFHVPVVRDAEPAAAVSTLRGRGFAVLAAAPHGEHSIEDVPLEGPVALLFGNEAGGLADESIALADVTVRIPIRGRAESLNLAAAASVLLFEVTRRNDRRTLAHLVAGAAHDLRSPLTAIRAFAETLRTRWDRLDESGRLAAVEDIEADALRGGRLVARLADAARAASGTLSLTDEPVDVGTEAAEVASEASRTGRQRPEVRTAGSALVRGDRQRVNGLLAALVE